MARRKRHGDIDPALLEACTSLFSSGHDFFEELPPHGWSEEDLPMLWDLFGRSWLRNGMWDPERFPTLKEPFALTKLGPP